MAIKFGMTVADMIRQLTRGFRSVAGRDPDGLEKIKIQQEAVQRFKEMNKVVNMEGQTLDPSKPIMGGTQEGAALQSGIMRATGAKPIEARADISKYIKDGKPDDDKLNALVDRDRILKEEADSLATKGENYERFQKISAERKNIREIIEDVRNMFPDKKAEGGRAGFANGSGLPIDPMDPTNKLDEVINAFRKLSKRSQNKIGFSKFFKTYAKENFATGGRAGFKLGSIDKARRAFLKTVGAAGAGIGALKTGILGLGEKAAPMVEAAKETVTQAPSYFFDLVAKIKLLGEPRRTPSYRERVNEYQYTGKDGNEYLLTEELDTGDIMIQKDKIGGRSFEEGSYDVIEDRTEMVFRKGQADETTKGKPADEYEEYKVEFDQDGTAADATDIDELSKKEIIKEATGNAPPIKKAAGGIAGMLGE